MIIAIACEKGGVAKTVTSIVLGVELAKRGYKILLIDTDQQLNLTDTMMTRSEIENSCIDMMINDIPFESCVYKKKDLDFIPADHQFKIAETRIRTERPMDGAYILKKILNPIKTEYDFIIIDTARGSGMIPINVLTASDAMLIPLSPDIYGIQGTMDVIETMQGVRKHTDSSIFVEGLLITRYRKNTNLHQESKLLIEKIACDNNTSVYQVPIRESITVPISNALRQTPIEYDKKAPVSLDLLAFVDEFIERHKNRVSS